jgi:hypothetical protein
MAPLKLRLTQMIIGATALQRFKWRRRKTASRFREMHAAIAIHCASAPRR